MTKSPRSWSISSPAGSIPANSIDIGAMITKITDELPHEADVERVRQHLPDGL